MCGQDAQRELAANDCYVSTYQSPTAAPARCILLADTLSEEPREMLLRFCMGTRQDDLWTATWMHGWTSQDHPTHVIMQRITWSFVVLLVVLLPVCTPVSLGAHQFVITEQRFALKRERSHLTCWSLWWSCFVNCLNIKASLNHK